MTAVKWEVKRDGSSTFVTADRMDSGQAGSLGFFRDGHLIALFSQGTWLEAVPVDETPNVRELLARYAHDHHA